MRRLARWTLNAVTVLSLVLCVATCVVWVRSFFTFARVHWQPGGPSGDRTFYVAVGRGGLDVGVYATSDRMLTRPSGDRVWAERASPHYPSGVGFYLKDVVPLHAGFGFKHEPGYPDMGRPFRVLSFTSVIMPLWAIMPLFLVLPALAYRRYRAGQGATAGRCASCSYDLTGNVSGVCPECGARVAVAETIMPAPDSLLNAGRNL